jgi:hypothetical protein
MPKWLTADFDEFIEDSSAVFLFKRTKVDKSGQKGRTTAQKSFCVPKKFDKATISVF